MLTERKDQDGINRRSVGSIKTEQCHSRHGHCMIEKIAEIRAKSK